MTTEDSHPIAGILGRVVVLVVVVAVGLVLVAAFLDGSTAAWGAAIGAGVALGFFIFGAVVVAVASQLAPQFAVLIAVLTYALQLVSVLVVFAALGEDALADQISRGWVGAGVIVATLAWLPAQVLATVRARIPIYRIDAADRVRDAATSREASA